jgi:hypothetical protein
MKRLTALLLAACGPGAIELPTPPASLTAAAAEYDNPTGTVPIDDVSRAVSAASDRLTAVQDSRLGPLIGEGLSDLRQRLSASGLSVAPLTSVSSNTRIDAWVRSDRTCQGWDDSRTAPDPANGSLSLTAVMQGGYLQREIWGVASACKGRIGIVHVFADGAVGAYLMAPLPESGDQARAAFRLDGTVGTEQRTRRLTLDFRVSDGGIAVLVPVADGQVVASASGDGLELRGRNGDFVCALETGTCSGH